MILRFLSALAVLTLLYACGGGSSTAASTDPAPAAAPVISYPSIDVARLEYLYANATYMDATFYTLPVSINQSELPQIQSTLTGIGSEAMDLQPGCQPIGHIWFQVNGENVEEADIYFQEECVGYVWYEEGKPAYSNKMMQAGVNFYANIMQSVQSQTGGQ